MGGAEEFYQKLDVCGVDPDAKEQWTRLMARIRPLGDAIFGLPPSAIRRDAYVGLTMGRYAPALADVLLKGGSSLQEPFLKILDEEKITDPFIRNWLDLICFLLQGATTKDAPTTLMAYMLSDFYRPNVVLDFPKGGTQSIVSALTRGVTKHQDCHLRLNTHITKLLVDQETGRASGVETADGTIIKATTAVISNADVWSTRNMVDAVTAPALAAELDARIQGLERCASFFAFACGDQCDRLAYHTQCVLSGAMGQSRKLGPWCRRTTEFSLGLDGLVVGSVVGTRGMSGHSCVRTGHRTL